MRATAILSVILCIGPSVLSAKAHTWFVNPSGTGDAPTIQAAIDSSAGGDTVHLEPGNYTWANQASGNASGMIRMKNGIALIGNAVSPQSVVLDAQSMGRVIYGPAATNCTYTGLTITGGSKTFGPEYGGGLACGAGSRLVSCRFVNNSATRGVGACLSGGDVEIDNCAFSGNSCSIEGGAIYGSPQSIRNSTFENNSTASTSGGIYSPGGIELVEACHFNNNVNQALMVMGGALNLRQCEFRGSGQNGVWMYAVTAEITQCLFSGLYAAIHMEGEAIFRVSGCTIVNSVGSALRLRYGWLLMERCIIANGEDYFLSISQLPSDPIFICCDVYGNDNGGPDGGWFGYWAKFDGVNGNFSADPLFCDRDAGNYTLHTTSPCLPGNHPGGVSCDQIGVYGAGCSAAPVDVETTSRSSPALWPTSPNPFNPMTTIRFDLPQGELVTLAIYDAAGRRVRMQVNEAVPAGSHRIVWNGKADDGRPLASGVYFCRMEAGEYRENRRMMLVK